MDENSTNLVAQTSAIVSAFVGNYAVYSDDLAALIAEGGPDTLHHTPAQCLPRVGFARRRPRGPESEGCWTELRRTKAKEE
jgi:predicted transcriptional regulator